MQQQFNRIIKRIITNSKDSSILLAVSGGVDSMVLLQLFLQLPKELQPKRLVVAHVNHQLREQSEAEQQLVASVCQQKNIEYVDLKWDTIQHPISGIEATARQVRYNFFQQIMLEESIDYLVTAHHGDDQVETMLMKLVRGSSIEGVAGMKLVRPFANGSLVRPLLFFSKKQIRQWALEHAIESLEDESNYHFDYQRNRFRHSIIPLLKKENMQLLVHFQQISQQINDFVVLVEPIIEQAFERLFEQTDNGWCTSCAALKQESDPMQRQLFYWLLVKKLANMQSFISYKQIDEILQLVKNTQPNVSLNIGNGWKVERQYDKLLFYNENKTSENPTIVAGTQEYYVEAKRQQISLNSYEEIFVYPVGEVRKSQDSFLFEVDKDDFPLTIRHRLPKDIVRLQKEPPKHQKLKNWFINEKISLNKRKTTWLVCNCEEIIIAILPYRKPSLLLKTQETDKMIVEYIKRVEV